MRKMASSIKTFSDIDDIKLNIQNLGKGAFQISYRNCEEYDGMVLGLMIVFDLNMQKYELDLQWMCFGLDLYGDTLQESYVYQFQNLELLLDYLKNKYNIHISDIPIKYKFDPLYFPDPIKNCGKKTDYERAWQSFQQDFKRGLFLDPTLNLVYNSLDC